MILSHFNIDPFFYRFDSSHFKDHSMIKMIFYLPIQLPAAAEVSWALLYGDGVGVGALVIWLRVGPDERGRLRHGARCPRRR